jgi:hypothetical protein
MTYPTGGKHPLKVTTAVRVLPEALPYPVPSLRHTHPAAAAASR